jgi:hypothetical protein
MKATKYTPHYILNAFTRPYAKGNYKFLPGIVYETSCPIKKIVLCSVRDFCAN